MSVLRCPTRTETFARWMDQDGRTPSTIGGEGDAAPCVIEGTAGSPEGVEQPIGRRRGRCGAMDCPPTDPFWHHAQPRLPSVGVDSRHTGTIGAHIAAASNASHSTAIGFPVMPRTRAQALAAPACSNMLTVGHHVSTTRHLSQSSWLRIHRRKRNNPNPGRVRDEYGVELRRIELLTSSLRTKRSTN